MEKKPLSNVVKLLIHQDNGKATHLATLAYKDTTASKNNEIPSSLVVSTYRRPIPRPEEFSSTIQFISNDTKQLDKFLKYLEAREKAAVCRGDKCQFVVSHAASKYDSSKNSTLLTIGIIDDTDAENQAKRPKHLAVSRSFIDFRDMPKGCILHAHFSGFVPYRALLKCLQNHDLLPQIVFDEKKSELRFEQTGLGTPDDSFIFRGKDIDFALLQELVNAMSCNFEKLGDMFYGIIKFRSFLSTYMQLVLEQLLKENVDHVDLRLRLGTAFFLQGSRQIRLPIEEELDIYLQSQSMFTEKRKSFALIACFSKLSNCRRAAKYFSEIDNILRNTKYANLVAAYDLVGPEVKGNQLSFFHSIVQTASRPFFFHAGEFQSCKSNLEYALEHGGHRIAHGIHCIQFPNLLHQIKLKEICLEICPISNLKLNSVSNPHIYMKLIEAGLQLSISPDDPNKLEDTTLFHNLEMLQSAGASLDQILCCIITSYKFALFPSEQVRTLKLSQFKQDFLKWLKKMGYRIERHELFLSLS